MAETVAAAADKQQAGKEGDIVEIAVKAAVGTLVKLIVGGIGKRFSAKKERKKQLKKAAKRRKKGLDISAEPERKAPRVPGRRALRKARRKARRKKARKLLVLAAGIALAVLAARAANR